MDGVRAVALTPRSSLGPRRLLTRLVASWLVGGWGTPRVLEAAVTRAVDADLRACEPGASGSGDMK